MDEFISTEKQLLTGYYLLYVLYRTTLLLMFCVSELFHYGQQRKTHFHLLSNKMYNLQISYYLKSFTAGEKKIGKLLHSRNQHIQQRSVDFAPFVVFGIDDELVATLTEPKNFDFV